MAILTGSTLIKGLGRVSRNKLPIWTCKNCQRMIATTVETAKKPHFLSIEGRKFVTDEWTNIPQSILASIGRNLHLQKNNHPVSFTRSLIEAQFDKFKPHYPLSPVVTTFQNFDSLQFPPDHPGRSKTDTYYINSENVLRTHTSAHQAEMFNAAAGQSTGWLISADVYRRDSIDSCHYPVFHQMEGAMTWDNAAQTVNSLNSQLSQLIQDEVSQLPTQHNVIVSDPSPLYNADTNPLQACHNELEVQAASIHLKRTLETAFAHIFLQGRLAAAGINTSHEPLQMRWIEAYFPFTSPSWELEVLWQGKWLEVLGCGIIKQTLLNNCGQASRFGWAFGIGLERIAMLLFEIPDIRLFWSTDERFLSQFSPGLIKRFTPFSKHPACYKDVSFWLNSQDFHENDLMEVVRDTCGSLVEDVKITDEFTHPQTGRSSKCYRINYRSLERNLTNDEANLLHENVRQNCLDRFDIELR